MSVRIVTYLGVPALAGLGWERSPARLSDKALGVRWGMAFAPCNDQSHVNTPALLSLLFGGLPKDLQEKTVLVACADEDRQSYFGALLSGGEPVLEAEHLFESSDELFVWIARECAQDGLDAIALTDELAAGIDLALPTVEIARADEAFKPACATGRSKKSLLSEGGIGRDIKHKLLLGGTVVVCVGAAFTFSQVRQPPPDTTNVIAQKTLYVSRDERTFLEGCAAAFEETWPIAPGWQRDIAGCTGAGMRAVSSVSASNGPIAFQVYRLRSGWDVSVARKAAQVVLRAGADTVTGTADTLVVTRPLTVEQLESAAPPPEGPDVGLQSALEAAFLGKARSVRPLGPDFEITLWGRISDMTEPLADLAWAEVASLDARDGLITALVRSKQAMPIQVPDVTGR